MKMAWMWTSAFLLCVAGSATAQQNESPQNKNEQQQQKAEPNKEQSEQAPKKLAQASLEEGQSISLPPGGELLKLTVAVPEEVHSGQRYRLLAKIENTSDNIMLTNVKLVQTGGTQIDIESAKVQSNAQTTNDQQKQQQQAQQQNAQVNAERQAHQHQQAQQDQQTAGQDGSWQLGSLKPGQSATLTLTAIARQTGNLEHCLSVKYDQSICAMVKVIKPQLEIAKTGPEQVTVCQPFEYRYELTNTGTGPAENFVIHDELPEGIVTETGKDTLQFRVPSLKEGETKAFVAKVHAMKEGELASRARVEQETGQSHESQRVTTKVVAPELQLTLNGPRMMKANDAGNFNATVKNTSDVPAQNVELIIRPGENLRVADDGQGDARDGAKAYRYSIGNLEPQQEQTITVSLNGQEQGEYKLDAIARSVCGRDQEMTIAEAKTSLSTQVRELTSLAVTLVDLDDVIPTGDPITYRVRVKNQGETADRKVQVALQLPDGLKFEKAEGPEKPQAEGQKVTLGPVDQLPPGEMIEWTVTTLTESAGEKLVKASLTSEELEKPVESEEISTIFDANQNQTQSSQDSSESSSQSQEQQSQSNDEQAEQ